MLHERPEISRADLPDELTAEALREVPMSVLGRLRRHGNGVLDADEQAVFDAALHEVMSETAGRVSRQLNRGDWEELRRRAERQAGRAGRGSGRPSRVDEQLRRIARRIDDQADAAQALAPGVDWSFAQTNDEADPATQAPAPTDAPDPAPSEDAPEDHADGADAGSGTDTADTVADLEDRLNEQVELVQVMNEIADVSRRTFELEQQRDLSSTRSVFFGFVVSVAVLVAGWAPLVAAENWTERWWVIGLTLGTCVLAGGVYGLVRRVQLRRAAKDEDDE